MNDDRLELLTLLFLLLYITLVLDPFFAIVIFLMSFAELNPLFTNDASRLQYATTVSRRFLLVRLPQIIQTSLSGLQLVNLHVHI